MAIKIAPSKVGTFTTWAKAHGMSVQQAARTVMANPSKYSTAIVRKANFAKNAAGFNHNKKSVKRAGSMMKKSAGMKG